MILHAPARVPQRAPQHVAIIMDGNRRWAASKNLPALEGHQRGIRALRRIVTAASRAGVAVLTVYAFSEENWERSSTEVDGLMDLGTLFARHEAASLARDNVRVRLIGRRERLPNALRTAFTALEERTAGASGIALNIAVNYGARSELCDAVKSLAREIVAGRMEPDAIDDTTLGDHLYTRGMPDPDLLIRTGGDLRLSNFLLYQCAYTELMSTRTPWPEFDAAAFDAALATYATRQRRFGR